MKLKQETSRRNYKAGYVVIKGIVDGSEFKMEDFEASYAETPDGIYIGSPRWAYRLCNKRGIKPVKHDMCCIGFCEKEQKWYGWSHRAICGFGVGDEVQEGDCAATTGWLDENVTAENDLSLPVGFQAQSLDDAKLIAIAFAESVS